MAVGLFLLPLCFLRALYQCSKYRVYSVVFGELCLCGNIFGIVRHHIRHTQPKLTHTLDKFSNCVLASLCACPACDDACDIALNVRLVSYKHFFNSIFSWNKLSSVMENVRLLCLFWPPFFSDHLYLFNTTKLDFWQIPYFSVIDTLVVQKTKLQLVLVI